MIIIHSPQEHFYAAVCVLHLPQPRQLLPNKRAPEMQAAGSCMSQTLERCVTCSIVTMVFVGIREHYMKHVLPGIKGAQVLQ